MKSDKAFRNWRKVIDTMLPAKNADSSIMAKSAILIHGTFAGKRTGVTQWYELGREDNGSFINRLEAALREKGVLEPITWHVFSWSGANTHRERLLAAETLYALIRDVLATSEGSELILLAHSHGGNVALKALELLWRRGAEGERVFDLLLRAVGIERVLVDRVPSHVIASDPRLSDVSLGLRTFLKSVVLLLTLSLRFQARGPRNGDAKDQERWLAAARRSFLVGVLLEPFCVRWSAERRSPVHLMTMGTPFFQKAWNPQPSFKSARAWLARIAVAALVATALCGAGWVIFKSHSIPPSGTALLQVWLWSVGVVLGLGLIFRLQQQRTDTNVYFNIHPGYGGDEFRVSELPWRLSVIQAGLLDEALLTLSAEPLILAELAPRLTRPLTPRLSWALPADATGDHSGIIPLSPQHLLKQAVTLAGQWIYNATIGFALRLLGWIATFVAHQFLLRTLLRSIKSGGFGIPEREFNDARVTVVPIPSLDAFFRQQMWDATRALVEEAPVRPTTADRHAQWGFLWDEELLGAEVRSSPTWKRVSAALPHLKRERGAHFEDEVALQRVTVALEERLREASGLVPLNHSGYYSNQKVIGKLSEWIA